MTNSPPKKILSVVFWKEPVRDFNQSLTKHQKKHIGSKFDDFLKEEGLLEEAESVAAKRVFFQIEKEMKRQRVDKSELAARALGKHLKISLA